MGLLANPQSYTVDSIAKNLEYIAQLPSTRQIIGKYSNDGGSLTALAKNEVSNSPTQRSAFGVSYEVNVAGVVEKYTATLSLAGPKTGLQSNKLVPVTHLLALMGLEGVPAKFVDGQI